MSHVFLQSENVFELGAMTRIFVIMSGTDIRMNSFLLIYIANKQIKAGLDK